MAAKAGPSSIPPEIKIEEPDTEHQLKLHEAILLAARSKGPGGITDEEIKQKLPKHVTNKQRAEAYNKLLKKGRLILRTRDDVLYYEEVSKEAAQKLRGLGADDRLVYDLIEKSGNLGIWSRELRQKSGLVQNQFNKVLKTLESRRMIKSVKSVKAKNKKFYMLADLEPSKELTGGPWYSEQKEYDVDFIVALHTHIEHFMKKHGDVVTSKEMVKIVKDSGISNEVLDTSNMIHLLEILVDDGIVERVNHEERVFLNGHTKTGDVDISELQYRIRPPLLEQSNRGLETPCASCPVRNQCRPGGAINPIVCPYMNEWLQF